MQNNKKLLFILCSFLMLTFYVQAQRRMEYLDRGLMVVKKIDGSNFVSWRSLVTDAPELSFDIYRNELGEKKTAFKKLNAASIQSVTSFEDLTADASKGYVYQLKALLKGKVVAESSVTQTANAKPYLSIPLQTPIGYAPNDGSVGDLDGDGQYEIIIHMVGKAKDNSQAGFTDPPIIQAYKLNGTLLWSINLGKNIREGAHYTQMIVYDLDGDGSAELAVKTADGSMDGLGNVIGDSTKDWRNARGYILAGPEYLTVFSGRNGAALATTDFIPPRHPDQLQPDEPALKAIWGDGYGNRMDRYLGAVAYLDGKHPSLIMSRGYYTRTVITAWDFHNGSLAKRWSFDSDAPGGANRAYRGQGFHNLTITDVDMDGKDEIVFGAMTLDDDGKGLYSTGLGHGDALHVSDLDPSNPGLEVFGIQERFDDAGAHMTDAKTGNILWKLPSVKAGEDGEGPGRALSIDIDPRYEGSECWVAGAGIRGLYTAKGVQIADKTPACNMSIFWDGDVLSEILNGTQVGKWDFENSIQNSLLDVRNFDCVSNNGSKSNPVLSADLFGDWREELIYRTKDNKELRIFSTTIPTDKKFYTFMQDPQYRLSIVWQNVAYNQPPHTSFQMGQGMKNPPKPNIFVKEPAYH